MSHAVQHTGKMVRLAAHVSLFSMLMAVAWNLALNRAQSQSSSGAASTYQQIQQQLASQDVTFRNPYGAVDPLEVANRARRLKAINAQRQKSIVEDTNRLLRLTADLNTEVNSEVKGEHPKQLNADQLRRLAEIEKLAKSVREKMSDAVGSTPPMPVMDGRSERFPLN